ncbi:peroxiredoxin family protein [Alienimonas chondri]
MLSVVLLPAGRADEPATETDGTPTPETPAGHSDHGEAFNEGPRQAAYLMGGTGAIDFPVTTSEPDVQRFINQGVGQLHGFWYFEAERSFRQAAALDPECGMAYWGMAMANVSNRERAEGFIKEASSRKNGATPREAKYIDALRAYYDAGKDDQRRRNQKYTEALEEIVLEHPDDLEAKAFLCLQIWRNGREGIPISSYLAADALLGEVFDEQPMHPAHHYRIHLWDRKRPEKALASAALCGQSAPGVAHMWHMPGHIYSKLKRYDAAAWQQEASARVDHAHMMRDRVLPDQIHNFAHNNEWLIRNLVHLGRASDAIDLARNMTELPRHPEYNTLNKSGSARYGRRRLFETLSRFELWDELLAYSETPYLGDVEGLSEQVQRLRYVGRACFLSNQIGRGEEQVELLEQLLAEQESRRDEAVEKVAADADAELSESDLKKAQEKARRPFSSEIKTIETALDELRGHQALLDGDAEAALKLFDEAGGVEVEFLVRVELAAGRTEEAVKRARDNVKKHENEVVPLATLVDALWTADKRQEAQKQFAALRRAARSADLDTKIMERVRPVAASLEIEGDWREVEREPASDLGVRPDLDSLGPFRWAPGPASPWTLTDGDGKPRSLADYQGEPVIVIFYLGAGCLHCVEQLQSFAPMTEQFRESGIALLAVSTDSPDALAESQLVYGDEPFPFPLVSDDTLEVFRQYRAYDDFEEKPLHGTFLIDGDGLIRWHDVSYEPFNDPEFLLEEANRLLKQSEAPVRTGSE